ncbi:AP2/B3 transcription factor family protein [Actinidia rufa]|uniref:AP2/B3 transcription factor family protein n=1 Tax=Actinidia rufa TaxID=165716 RepID=A0A7J0DZL6_9ERIC|nr:AP2/B3 transcription factor family protein [Actinidia rufa]
MEEEMSTVSNAISSSTKETSDSNSNNRPLHHNKRPREDITMLASKFKGVVGQQNGHWGAQIYANHQRIWLGTFKSEIEAAMAYDSAAIKLRSGDSYRNFPWTNVTFQEPNFQSHFSTEEVLIMIKDGSYPSKFADFLRLQFPCGDNVDGLNLVCRPGKGFLCRQLFQKELTPSDVGKLNRLVIPKKYAVRYFPRISEDGNENLINGRMEDVNLIFYDRLMRSWKFRYCYWKSSQSFVFTRGWNRFVKENELKEKDMVVFSVCECREGSNQIQAFCMIEVAFKDRVESSGSGVEDNNEVAQVLQEELKLDTQQDNGVGEEDSEEFERGLHLWQNIRGFKNDEKEIEEEKEETTAIESTKAEKKGVRIFGVQIC